MFGIAVLAPLGPYAVRAIPEDPWAEFAGWDDEDDASRRIARTVLVIESG